MIKREYGSESFGIIPNNLIVDEFTPDSVLSVYTVIRTLYFDINRGCSWVNFYEILKRLNVDSGQSKQTKIIQDAFTYLIDKKYIKLLDLYNDEVEFQAKNKTIYKVSFLLEDENNCFLGEGGMTTIPECNLIKLLNYIKNNKGIKKYQLIHFYLLIARGCSNNNQMWKLSQKYFHEVLGLAKETCSNWNNVLQDVGIIFYNNDYFHIKDGQLKTDTTIYFHRNNGENGYKNKITKEVFNEMAKEKLNNY